MWRELNRTYLPGAILLQADGGSQQKQLGKKLPFLDGIKPVDGKATAYICRDFACQAPITDLETLKKALGAMTPVHGP